MDSVVVVVIVILDVVLVFKLLSNQPQSSCKMENFFKLMKSEFSRLKNISDVLFIKNSFKIQRLLRDVIYLINLSWFFSAKSVPFNIRFLSDLYEGNTEMAKTQNGFRLSYTMMAC